MIPGKSVMSVDEYQALPESIRGRSARDPVGVVLLEGVTTPYAPREVRATCDPKLLRRTHVWMEAVAERNGWNGKVRSWVQR